MGYRIEKKSFDNIIKNLSDDYLFYAPTIFKGDGCFSDTDVVRYGEVKSIDEIEFEKKSQYSFKEAIMPISQTLFYFTEDKVTEPVFRKKGAIVFLRSCDTHAIKRLDEIYLKNGAEDYYYKALRENTKFILMGCTKSFDSCFCVDMGTNIPHAYDAYLDLEKDSVCIDSKWDVLSTQLESIANEKQEVSPKTVTENITKVNLPQNIDITTLNLDMWNEYDTRCIACGRCNFVCPTCTCFSMQDIFYGDNNKVGERRRVWASCHVDGYTDMAGGHSFRQKKGQRMRFKVLHKVYDFNKRFGYNMCTGCGRCDDVCPEYISFSNSINKLTEATSNKGGK